MVCALRACTFMSRLCYSVAENSASKSVTAFLSKSEINNKVRTTKKQLIYFHLLCAIEGLWKSLAG